MEGLESAGGAAVSGSRRCAPSVSLVSVSSRVQLARPGPVVQLHARRRGWSSTPGRSVVHFPCTSSVSLSSRAEECAVAAVLSRRAVAWRGAEGFPDASTYAPAVSMLCSRESLLPSRLRNAFAHSQPSSTGFFGRRDRIESKFLPGLFWLNEKADFASAHEGLLL